MNQLSPPHGYDGTYLEIVAPDLDYSVCQEGQVWYWETPDDPAALDALETLVGSTTFLEP